MKRVIKVKLSKTLVGKNMPKTRSLDIHTVIVQGDFESFKAAFTRSVLGVTFKKFKRRGRKFYQYRVHNTKVTHRVCSFLHEYLMKKTPNISNYELKTDLTLHWSESGKILKFSDVKVTLFLKAAEAEIEEMTILKKLDSITIDLFYSDIDAASQKLRGKIPEIMDSMGSENFEYHEWNILDNEGKEMAEKYRVGLVPTVIINADPELMLENPDERSLRNEIEELYVPHIEKSTPTFEKNEITKSEIRSLFVES